MSSFSQPDTDLVVPAFDVRALARRAAVPAGLAAAAAAAIVVAGGPLHAFAHALRRALDADPRWVIGGAIFELLSFAGYVALFWMVGSRATKRLGLRESTQVTLGGAAATRLLPTAGVGGAAMTCGRCGAPGWARAARRARCWASSSSCTRSSWAPSPPSGGLIALGLAHADGPLALSAIPAAAATAGHRRRAGPRRAPAADARSGRPPARGRRRLRRRRPRRDRPRALRRPAPARRPRLVDVRRRGPVGDAPRVRRGAPVRRRRARLLRRPGRQHDPDPRRRERRHRRRPRRLRGAGRPGARLRAGLPRDRHLAARADRPRRPRLPAPDDGALERGGRSGRAARTPAPAPVARTPRPCPEPALLAA